MKLLLSFIALIPLSAHAQFTQMQIPALCGETKKLVTILHNEFQEKPVWNAIDSTGFTISIWKNNKTNSFTVLKTNANGNTSCILSSGDPDPAVDPLKGANKLSLNLR